MKNLVEVTKLYLKLAVLKVKLMWVELLIWKEEFQNRLMITK